MAAKPQPADHPVSRVDQLVDDQFEVVVYMLQETPEVPLGNLAWAVKSAAVRKRSRGDPLDIAIEQCQRRGRRAILISAVSNEPIAEAPGLILLDEDGGVDTVTPQAESWLGDLASSPAQDARELPDIIYAVASAARRLGRGEAGGGGLARARVRAASDAGSCFTAPCSTRAGPLSFSNRRARPRSRR